MRELETSLQQFGEFILTARLVKENAAPYCVRWVRRFLTCPASDEPLADQVRTFCEALEREGRWADWQIRQAEHALRIYFVHFLKRTDWQKKPASSVVDERGHTSPLAALEQLRHRLRVRHYSYRTECSYIDWVRRFFDYLTERQGVPHPHVESDAVRDYATHLAVHRRVSASTQNQALSAILFLCREVLGVEVENLALATRAKRGIHLPVVLSMPETAALLGAMHGTTSMMAALIYGGGLRVSECCELRIPEAKTKVNLESALEEASHTLASRTPTSTSQTALELGGGVGIDVLGGSPLGTLLALYRAAARHSPARTAIVTNELGRLLGSPLTSGAAAGAAAQGDPLRRQLEDELRKRSSR